MTFDAAVNLAREIGHGTSQIAFVHAEPGSLQDFNFRFVEPIEDVPGTTAVSVARIALDGTMRHLAGPTGLWWTYLAKDRKHLRQLSAQYDQWTIAHR